jgi:hypothetical protein
LFSNDVRATVLAENPSLGVTDVIAELGARWQRAKRNGDVAQYRARAAELRISYRSAAIAYRRSAAFRRYLARKAHWTAFHKDDWEVWIGTWFAFVFLIGCLISGGARFAAAASFGALGETARCGDCCARRVGGGGR